MNKISINHNELTEIMEILKNFPNVNRCQIEEEGGNGIGTILYLSFFTDINGVDGEFKTIIRNVDSW